MSTEKPKIVVNKEQEMAEKNCLLEENDVNGHVCSSVEVYSTGL